MAVNGLYARGLFTSSNMGTEGLYVRGLFGAGAGIAAGVGTRSRTGRNRARGALFVILFLALWVA